MTRTAGIARCDLINQARPSEVPSHRNPATPSIMHQDSDMRGLSESDYRR